MWTGCLWGRRKKVAPSLSTRPGDSYDTIRPICNECPEMRLNTLLESHQPTNPTPDVQWTPFGIEVLDRFVWNTMTPSAAGTRYFDAGVIGAGIFGGYRANKGRQTGLRSWSSTPGSFVSRDACAEHGRDVGRNVPGPSRRTTAHVLRRSSFVAFRGAAR